MQVKMKRKRKKNVNLGDETFCHITCLKLLSKEFLDCKFAGYVLCVRLHID